MNDFPRNDGQVAGGEEAPMTRAAPLMEPIEAFRVLLAEATEKEPDVPTAASLATATPEGVPSVRMVLLKDVDERGFVFYTNMESQKGLEITANPRAALCFHWKSLRRQVRVEGAVEMVSMEEADAYFASRPRQARIGAWASDQSRALASRFGLEKSVARFTAKYAIGKIPRPPHWTGCRVVPRRIEFWENRPFRLHDRTLYVRQGDGWTVTKLFP